MSDVIGVTPLQILPVKNYCKEGTNDDKVDLLLLYTLERLLGMVDDFLQNNMNVAEDTNNWIVYLLSYHATEPGFAGHIDAIEVELIDWLIDIVPLVSLILALYK